MTLIEAGRIYYNWGYSVAFCDDKKKPLGSWKKAQEKLIEPKEKDAFGAHGVGMICGKVSGNLEVIDIDLKYDVTGTLYDRIKGEIKSLPFAHNFLVETSTNKGIHFYYKCEAVEGNIALSRRYATEEELKVNPKEKVKVLIETRGEGGYIVCAPTQGYQITSKKSISFKDVPTITPKEREQLHNILKKFDQTNLWTKKEVLAPIARGKKLASSPFDAFNMDGDVPRLLEEAGWTYVETEGNNMRFRRAGQTDSRTSADWHTDKRIFFCFTSSSEFEPSRGYNPVQVFVMLKYGSLNKETYSEAAKELMKMGYGDTMPELDAIDKQIEADTTGTYLADDSEADEFLEAYRNDELQMGVGIGMPSLDASWVFKPASFNMVGGMANIGKTDSFMWWLTMLSKRHGFNWMVCSMENDIGEIFKVIIEYYLSKPIKKIDNNEYIQAKAWAKKHFTVFSNKRIYTYHDVLNSAIKEAKKKAYAGLLIDPLSALEYDVKELKLYGEYRYNYRMATEFRLFTKNTKISIFALAHPNTEANKRMKNGYPEAPYAADIEYGSMWNNRCDNFLTLHRRISHPTEWFITEWHVRKIKSKFSGGNITSEPIRLERNVNCYYTDLYGAVGEVSYHNEPQSGEEEAPF